MNTVMNKKDRMMYVWVFLVVMLGCVLLCSGKSNIEFLSDHIGDLAVPSYLAGLDWSNLIYEASYYGYGYKWVFFILFKLSEDPVKIAIGIKVVNCIFRGIAAVFIYDIQKRFFELGKDWLSAFFAIVISVYHAGGFVNSEASIFVFQWVLIWCMLCFIKCDMSKKQIGLGVLLGLLVMYMLTLHERNWNLVMTTTFICTIDCIAKKQWRKWIAFVSGLGCGFVVQYILKQSIIEYFWLSRGEKLLYNTTVIASKTQVTWFLESFSAFKFMMKAFISNIVTLGFHTYGLLYIVLMLFVVACWKIVIKREKEICCEDIVLIFSVIATFVILFGVSTKWPVYYFCGNRFYGYKGFSYSRYYAPYIWPAVMVLFCYFRKNMVDRKMVLFSFSLMIGLVGLFFGKIYNEYLYANEMNANAHIERMMPKLWLKNGTLQDNFKLYIGVVILIYVAIIIFVTYSKSMSSVVLAIFIVLISARIIQTEDILSFETNFDVADSGYRLISQMRDENVNVERVYCNYNARYTYQFVLNRIPVINNMPGEDEINAIIFVQPQMDSVEFVNMGYEFVKLDDNEAILIKGVEYQQVIHELLER